MLNLDEIAPAEERVIKLDGEEHNLKVLTVEDVIANARAADRMKATKDEIEQFEILIEMVARSFPSVPAARWHKMSLQHLNAIFQFAQELGKEAEKEAQSEGNAPAAKAD
jgi:hypothetical protein